MITHVLLSHPHETTLLTVEEEIDMNSGRKLSGFLACLIMLIQIYLSKFLCLVRMIGLGFGLAYWQSHNPLNQRECGRGRAICAHDVSSVDGNVLGTHLAVIYTTFVFPEVGVESKTICVSWAVMCKSYIWVFHLVQY